MKLLDVTVVLAAHRSDHPQFALARACLDAMVEARSPFSVPDQVAGSFVRLATNRRIFAAPTSLDVAFDYVRALRDQPGHLTLNPGARHLGILEGLCLESDASGDLVGDAQIAAIAVEHGAEVISFDRDFARFADVRWSRP